MVDDFFTAEQRTSGYLVEELVETTFRFGGYAVFISMDLGGGTLSDEVKLDSRTTCKRGHRRYNDF